MQSGDHDLCLVFVKWVLEHIVPRKDNRAFHQVLQLANVARPRIPLEGSHGFRRNARGSSFEDAKTEMAAALQEHIEIVLRTHSKQERKRVA